MAYQINKLEKLAALLEQHALQEGGQLTSIENFFTFKSTTTHVRAPKYYEPTIVIVAQGKKHIYVGNKSYNYDNPFIHFFVFL